MRWRSAAEPLVRRSESRCMVHELESEGYSEQFLLFLRVPNFVGFPEFF